MKIQIVATTVSNDGDDLEDAFHVRLRDEDNGETVFWTENYPRKEDAENAVTWLFNNTRTIGANIEEVDERPVVENDEDTD